MQYNLCSWCVFGNSISTNNFDKLAACDVAECKSGDGVTGAPERWICECEVLAPKQAVYIVKP